MILFCAIIVFIIGLSFVFEIAPRYIKSVNTLSEEDLKKINIHRFSWNIGFAIILLSIILFVSHFNSLFKENYLFAATLLWCGLCIMDTIYMQKSYKYFGNYK